jgi:hypothetical protein
MPSAFDGYYPDGYDDGDQSGTHAGKQPRMISQAEDAMTPTQYKAALKALGLSQERAGDWLGIGRRTSQGYALGEYPVPEPVAKLLRLCVKMKLDPEDVK